MVIKIYRFFQKHQPVFWLAMLCSFAFFVFFGLQVTYEEDLTKLLPAADDAEAVGLAFSDLKVKDKIFVQFAAREADEEVDEYTLSDACDYFVETLEVIDGDDHDIADDVFYQLDQMTLYGAVQFLFDHLPSYVDSTALAGMDSLFSPAALRVQMERNMELIEGNPDLEELVLTDPVGMRNLLLGGGDAGGMTSGFALLNGHLFTPDSTEALAFLQPNFKSLDSGTGTRLNHKMKAAIDSVTARYPQVAVYYHGSPIESVNNSHRIKLDLVLTLGLSLLIIAVLLMLAFRNYGTLPMLLLPIVYGAFFALSIIYFIQGGMSLMALGLGAIVLGVALSYCLHVLTHYKYVSDPERVLREQTKPVLMGSLTTIGAFAGLLLTKSALLRDFGLFALLAVAGTTFACLFFMPQFFRPEDNRRSERAFRLMERINSYPFDRRNWLLITMLLVAAVCVFFSGRVQFDSDLKNIGYHGPEVTAAKQLYAQKTAGGLRSQFYAVSSTDLDSALAFNAHLHSVCRGLQESGAIAGYSKASSRLLVSTPVQQQRIDAWKAWFTPQRVATIRQRVVQAGTQAGFMPDAFDTFLGALEADYEPASVIEADVLPAGLLTNFVEPVGDKYLVFTSIQMPEENLDAVNALLTREPHTIVIDPFYYTGNMVRLLHDDFNRILGISSLFVFLLLLVSLRNVFISIIAFLPMALSWYVVEGVMAIFGVEFNLINIIISTFIFGIGVDYSIFVMDGLLAAAKGGDTGRLLYHKTAILLSAFVLIVCMGSLLFAGHPAMASVGFAALVGMISTIMITYTFEPFLFHLLEQTRFGRRVIEKTRG